MVTIKAERPAQNATASPPWTSASAPQLCGSWSH